MSEWQNTTLGDVITLHYGKALKAQNRIVGNIPVYSSAGITGYHNEPLVMSKGIIIGRKGTVGKVYYSPEPFFCIDTAYYILPNETKYDFIWLYYQLGTIGLEELNEDSAVPGLNRTTAYSQDILIPSIAEQKAIASVLSSLDNKIDLLHRQNKTLESMAETLFRQWFVEEAQDDWDEIKLGALVTVKRGGSPRPIQDYISDSGYRWLKISDVTGINSPFIFDIKEHIKEEGLPKTTLLKAGKLVLSNSATPGIPKILMVDSCIHDGWLHFPVSALSNEFLYILFKHIRSELVQLGNGSIFTNLKTDILKEFPIKKPNEDFLQKFQLIMDPIFNGILGNTKQIQTLENLRDTLLPKLMSGEVRVKYTPEEIKQ
ncbi:TPA: restriction endonuclease subunit S [Morganella morganii]|nr:restriction endonuclease subunit S [Morganella morganii]HDF2366574.1 restriction endonuclease subunit S [Morganella morganii]HDF2423967.1 restriction endonuclease subunit S [Morganella morganii]HDF2424726.1 restriction endonuclease subunit S [Morganella morganii]